jgi:hypothetical protein
MRAAGCAGILHKCRPTQTLPLPEHSGTVQEQLSRGGHCR